MAKQLPNAKQPIKAAKFGKNVEDLISTYTRHADLTQLVLGAYLSKNFNLLSSGDSVEEDEDEDKPLLAKRKSTHSGEHLDDNPKRKIQRT